MCCLTGWHFRTAILTEKISEKSADVEQSKAASVMRPKTVKSFNRNNQKCLAGGDKHAIIKVNY